ncbi:MAG TPA: hypothetical protein VH437_11640 [Terriglobales bacterium]|jgi:hypothetical protein
MRKLAFFSVLVLTLMATGVTPAHAAGPYCIHLTNFCDTLSVSTSGGNTYGQWDWTCDGVTITDVIGVESPGLITEASLPNGLGYATNFNFHKATHLFDLWATGGTFVFPFQLAQPYSITLGNCVFNGPKNGKPSLKGLQ